MQVDAGLRKEDNMKKKWVIYISILMLLTVISYMWHIPDISSQGRHYKAYRAKVIDIEDGQVLVKFSHIGLSKYKIAVSNDVEKYAVDDKLIIYINGSPTILEVSPPRLENDIMIVERNP